MLLFKTYTYPVLPSPEQEEEISCFLHEHLEQYGDTLPDIRKAIGYALKRNRKPGGLLITAREKEELAGAVVINHTGMDGYIPENILVYIATHKQLRGKGIGRRLMEEAIRQTEGAIALHVEPDNPARKLYEKLGFTHKYLEMRLNK